MAANQKRTSERHLRAGKRLSELLTLMRGQRKRCARFRAVRSVNADKAWALIPAANVEIPRSWLVDWQRRGWIALEWDGEHGHTCTLSPTFDEQAVTA